MARILKDTLSFFSGNLVSIFVIVIPLAFVKGMFDISIAYLQAMEGVHFRFLGILPFISNLLYYPIYTGALIILFSKILAGDKWSFRGCLSTSLHFWPRLFIVLFFRVFCLFDTEKIPPLPAREQKSESAQSSLFSRSQKWLAEWAKSALSEIKNRKFKIVLAEFRSPAQAALFTFIIWWVTSWFSGEFFILIVILLNAVVFGPLAIAHILWIFPANIFVNCKIISYLGAFDSLPSYWLYVVVYWGIFILLHFFTIARRKLAGLGILALFLLITAYSCSDRVSHLFK